jgi:hypothetical protein
MNEAATHCIDIMEIVTHTVKRKMQDIVILFPLVLK